MSIFLRQSKHILGFTRTASHTLMALGSFVKSLPVRKLVGYACRIYLITPYQFYKFLLVSWGGVRLSSLGEWATNWPIVPAPDGRW
jgi:hypothetical protein